jgi:hypothetical protein
MFYPPVSCAEPLAIPRQGTILEILFNVAIPKAQCEMRTKCPVDVSP